jgi:hypothetical protein
MDRQKLEICHKLTLLVDVGGGGGVTIKKKYYLLAYQLGTKTPTALLLPPLPRFSFSNKIEQNTVIEAL